MLLALAIGGTIAGGAVLARVPASAEHAAATASAARSTLARVQYGYCPSTTLPCP